MTDQNNCDLQFQSGFYGSSTVSNNAYSVNELVKKYLRDLYEETMFKGKGMSDNLTIHFDSTKGNLYVEYIGYKGTDFHNGQYFILFVLPSNYPDSPPKISVLTESGRFYPKIYLSLSISDYHSEIWQKIPLTFLIVSMISAFPDYDMIGVGHINIHRAGTTAIVKKLVEKTRDYNKQHNFELYEIFSKINELKMNGTKEEIDKYIDDMINSF